VDLYCPRFLEQFRLAGSNVSSRAIS
jgi:hypothetical protein